MISLIKAGARIAAETAKGQGQRIANRSFQRPSLRRQSPTISPSPRPALRPREGGVGPLFAAIVGGIDFGAGRQFIFRDGKAGDDQARRIFSRRNISGQKQGKLWRQNMVLIGRSGDGTIEISHFILNRPAQANLLHSFA